MEPSYLKVHREGGLSARIKKAVGLMADCRICPRECGVNRLEGELGFCSTGRNAKVASYNAHFGEEAPLVGRYGSGTIFLSSCNLLCSFCQNYEISHLHEGVEIEPEQMAAIMMELSEKGCHNINFVTPSHVVPQLLEALPYAIEMGLRVPLVYNTGGYDGKETLKLLEGIFDIYMPDFKFWDDKWSEKFCNAPDYSRTAMEAIKEMYRQVGDLKVQDGVATKGLLVRHLVMPKNIAGTDRVMGFLAAQVSPNTYVNIMDQYRPCGNAVREKDIKRRLISKEYIEAVDMAKTAGISRLDSRERPRLMFRF